MQAKQPFILKTLKDKYYKKYECHPEEYICNNMAKKMKDSYNNLKEDLIMTRKGLEYDLYEQKITPNRRSDKTRWNGRLQEGNRNLQETRKTVHEGGIGRNQEPSRRPMGSDGKAISRSNDNAPLSRQLLSDAGTGGDYYSLAGDGFDTSAVGRNSRKQSTKQSFRENLSTEEKINSPTASGTNSGTRGLQRNVKQSFKDFLKENSDFYKKKGLLKEEQEQTNILNTYVSYKTGKTKVSDITDAERQQALVEINKLPDEDKPFYVPRIYEENLSVSQNKILGKDFDPRDIGELKKRKHVGASRTINDGRLTRVFSPRQIAKQLSDHRARLEGTEGYIDSVTKSFAKPIKDGKVEKGYVPYNPEAIKATFLDNTNLAKDTIDGLNEGHPYSQALNRALSKCAPEIKKSVEEAMEAVKTDATMQIPENVMKELIKNSDKGTTNAGLAIWDIGTNAFKTNVLGLNAKWFINNRIGNAIMGGMKGVNLLNPTNISKINKLADDLFPESISGNTFMSKTNLCSSDI